MVPMKEFDQLVQYYKEEITDNALLNKAGQLAAESHVILRDKSIPDSIAIKKIKPLARQRGRLTKCIRQIGPLSSNKEPTSITESSSTLTDLICTNYSDRVSCSRVSDIGISDHSLVYVYRKLFSDSSSKGHSFISFRNFRNFNRENF